MCSLLQKLAWANGGLSLDEQKAGRCTQHGGRTFFSLWKCVCVCVRVCVCPLMSLTTCSYFPDVHIEVF